MVDTTISPPATLDPPFREAPQEPGSQPFSQPWNAYFTNTAARVSSMSQQLATIDTGVTDGSDAAAGQIGEYLTASASVPLTGSMSIANIVSIDLTAGDWDVTGNCVFHAGAGTHSFFGCGIGGLDTYTTAAFPTGAIDMGLNTALARQNVTATTTVWLVAEAGFTGSMTAVGTIRARRVR
jgi:hypothetical protein